MNDVLDKQKLVLNANLLGKILSVYWRSLCKESEIFYSINVFLKLIIYIYIYIYILYTYILYTYICSGRSKKKTR